MLPFLETDMFQLIFNLLERFVKVEALAEVISTAKLVQLDLTKRKATLEELVNLREVKIRIKANIEALLKSADQFAEEAESTGKVTLISKSNAMRKSLEFCPQKSVRTLYVNNDGEYIARVL